MSGLSELITRLEKATDRDYALDLEIACEFGPFIRKRWIQDGVPRIAFFERSEPLKGQMAFACGEDRPETRWSFLSTPNYTSSMDAALSLLATSLPGWCWTTASYWCEGADKPPFYADVGELPKLEAGDDSAIVTDAFAATPPLALCLAILRALKARDALPRPLQQEEKT